uniref:TM2 domain-containing protein n=1 Tax=Trichuris muris TaxID=70415 RepID=A0A5S6QNS5_TRIMR
MHFATAVLIQLVVSVLQSVGEVSRSSRLCSQLLPGQYLCDPIQVNPDNDVPLHCDSNGFALTFCTPIAGLNCDGLINGTFIRSTDERCPRHKSFKTALLLAVFCGWLGLDRLYLGYVAFGLAKMSTLGFFFLWHLVDIILIALQVLQPADGSRYEMDLFGPRVEKVLFENSTNILPDQ